MNIEEIAENVRFIFRNNPKVFPPEWNADCKIKEITSYKNIGGQYRAVTENLIILTHSNYVTPKTLYTRCDLYLPIEFSTKIC